MEVIVVYQVKSGKFGYRSIGHLDSQNRGNMLMESLLGSDWGVVQCWMTEAENGGKAITKVKKHLSLLSLSSVLLNK